MELLSTNRENYFCVAKEKMHDNIIMVSMLSILFLDNGNSCMVSDIHMQVWPIVKCGIERMDHWPMHGCMIMKEKPTN